MNLYVGRDVGGWHCDRNPESRDALVVLGLNEGSQPTLIGQAWRGSLRTVLSSHRGPALLKEMLRLCNVDLADAAGVMVAIDAPLGWPAAMLALVNGGGTADVSDKDDGKLYTRRETELDLIRQGFSPLSSVRDMIGSQSTRAIHFLRAAGLPAQPAAVWSDGRITAIETYPAVALKHARCASVHKPLFQNLLSQQAITTPAMADVRDALACAVVAYLTAEKPESVVKPPAGYPALEGWIIVPTPTEVIP